MTAPDLTLHEAAALLGVHYMTAYRYVRLGLLPAAKSGGSWRVTAADLEQFQQAADLYEEVLAIDASQKVAANNLAMLLVDRLSSEQNLERALEITADFGKTKVPTFWDTRGWVYHQSQDYANALPLLEKAVGTKDPPAVFRYHLGMTYYKLSDNESARSELQASLKDDSEFFGADDAVSILDKL